MHLTFHMFPYRFPSSNCQTPHFHSFALPESPCRRGEGQLSTRQKEAAWPWSWAASPGLHHGDAASPGDTVGGCHPPKRNSRARVMYLEGVESAVAVCPREAEKPGPARRGGFPAEHLY